MGTDYLSNLPIDLYKEIFFNHSSEESRCKCLNVNKRINECVSILLLSDLNIPLDGTLKPYSQLVKHYKSYCDFFRKKLPHPFELTTCKTIMEAKRIVDNTLCESFLLEDSWGRFIDQIDPPPDDDSENDEAMTTLLPNNENSLILEPNEEVHMFLRAGARISTRHADVFGSIMKQSWCSLETAQMLLACKIEITMNTMYRATRSEKFKFLLPDLLKNIQVDPFLFFRLFRPFSSYEHLIKDYYLAKLPQVSNNDIADALRAHYSEQFISDMLVKCSDNVTPYVIELALDERHSEYLILDLLKKCSETLKSTHLSSAIDGYYPTYLIEKLLARISDKITAYPVERAIRNDYPEAFMALLMDKVEENHLTESLESLIAGGSYHMTVEKFLPQSTGFFTPGTIYSVVKNNYSEDVFLTMFNRTKDKKQCLKDIWLGDVMNVYSAQTVGFLIDQGVVLNM